MGTGVTEPYLRNGVEYRHELGRLFIDMAAPRLIEVVGLNSLTGKEKIYILKVTEKGICLV
jgi:hypothetical protein